MTKPKHSKTPVKLPTQEYLHLNFYYNPSTGKMYARYKRGGRPIGRSGYANPSHGYLVRMIDGNYYREHRLIYMYHHGIDPGKKHVDHIDGNPLNNKIDNLRLVTKRQNNQNNNVAKGYTWDKIHGKYKSRIKYRGKVISLGYFTCPLLAHQAYNDARQKYFKEYAPKYI